MDGYPGDKKYEPFKIPPRQGRSDGAAQASPQAAGARASLPDGQYYEIEYGAGGIPGVGKFVLKAQKIEPQDEIRELFHRMRDIAREDRAKLSSARFFDQRTRLESSKVFYRQGLFMKDFADEYAEPVPYSDYFPYYQMMGYEQLRTYFTWRTEVRKGNVADTSLSYAFLYMYELINNIGVDDPLHGLNALMSFWQSFRLYNATIDRYLWRWLKDYHIYYELPHSFKAFVDQNGLAQHYPAMGRVEDAFDLYCAVSKYDIRKSAFFMENEKLCADCFRFVLERLERVFAQNGVDLEACVLRPTKKLAEWRPFKDALFYSWEKQADRRVVISESELYLCSAGRWEFSTVLAGEEGRQLAGYVMKQTESVLRKALNYKYKLSANADALSHKAAQKLKAAGLELSDVVSDAALEFYKEATKTVVRVDHDSLSKIRREALATQEKLIVPEQETPPPPAAMPSEPAAPVFADEPAPLSDTWAGLRQALDETELAALAAALYGEAEVRKFALACGVMPEVLIDGINQKAMDWIGDSLVNENLALYGDYLDQVKEMVE